MRFLTFSASTLALVPIWMLGTISPSHAAEKPVPMELIMEQARMTPVPNTAAYEEFINLSVAMSPDLAVIGLPVYESYYGYELPTASVEIYRPEGTNWILSTKLNLDGPFPSSQFGTKVAISGDSSTLVVGDRRSGRGAVYVYQQNDTNWIQQAELLSTAVNCCDGLGNAVDISGDTLVAGAQEEDTGRGAAYVFVRNGTNWTLQTRLVANDRAQFDFFGSAVTIEGDTVVVGAASNDDGGSSTGSAYIFERSGTAWGSPQKLLPGAGGIGSGFGSSVELFGNLMAIGATADDSNRGAVHLYARTNTTWTFQQKLKASDGQPNDFFGRSVALQENVLVTGAVGRGGNNGAVYVFGKTGVSWAERNTLTTVGANTDRLGSTIALQGTRVFAGAYGQNVDRRYGAMFDVSYADPEAVANWIRNFLYYDAAAGSSVWERDLSAFRYKTLLFGQDTNGIRARLEMMSSFYGDPERELAIFAEEALQLGLAVNPDSPSLGNLVLDINYDRTVAETIFAKETLVQAGQARFGPPWAPPAGPSGFLIDNEIPLYRDAVDASRFALEGYFTLLTNRLGSPLNPPLGYQFFSDLVPTRGLMPATYTNASGMNMIVTTNTASLTNGMLYTSHKDLVLLFDLMRDYGRNTRELGRLLMARKNPGDSEEVESLLTDAQRFLYLQGNLLKNIFPDRPTQGDPSGLEESIQGWHASLDALRDLDQLRTGDSNLLGFAPDFLMLVENFQDPTNPLFDSFDTFAKRLGLASLDSPLKRAVDRLGDARTDFDRYKGYEDQIREQYIGSTVSYEFRLFEIVGARPGMENYSNNPTNNPGSELDQQVRSIEAARLKILRNKTEINNLAEEVQIEVNRAGSVQGTIIRYGNKQAEVTKQIGHIKAAQAGADRLAAAFSPEKLLTGAVVIGVLNAAAQAGAEEGIAHLEAQKEQLAAQEQSQIEGINSAARVKTLMLGMRTLAVDSMEAALLMQQEIARLAGLFREKADLEARIAERNADLASRYFADPIHRLAAESSRETANLNFSDAQRWLFFMARALEYKWNSPFENFQHPPEGRIWSLDALFKLRNADELLAFYDAMVAFDFLINRGKAYRFDWFSVREDFMNLTELDDLGNPAEYVDTRTGQTLDAISMFRTNLLRSVFNVQNGQFIQLDFNTVRQIPGGFFFVGPTFDTNGNVLPDFKGRFLDKIDYLQIRLPGTHSLGRSQLAGNLTYGGTSFIRNLNVGHFQPDRPDRLVDEMTPYSTRYWFYDPSPDQMKWRFNEGLTINAVEMELSADPRIPPSASRIEEFKERSVAATGWKLTIPLVQQNVTVLDIDELNDVELYFYHYSAQRQ